MKNSKALWWVVVINTLYNLMQGISALAIPWFFIKTKDMSSQWGLIYLSITILTLFWGIYAGTIVDKYNRKKVLFYNPLLCGIILTFLSFVYSISDNDIFISALCFGVIFFSYSLYFPNLYAICQEMTHSKDYGRVNSILEIQGQFSLIIAGSIAALMMNGATSGNWPIFGFDVFVGFKFNAWPLDQIIFWNGVGLIITSFFANGIKYELLNIRKPDGGSIGKRIKEGFVFMFSHKMLFLFGMTSFMVFCVVLVINFMLSPQYIAQHLMGGDEVYGTSEIYFGMGSALAGVLIYQIFKKYHALYGICVLIGLTTLVLFFSVVNSSIFYFYVSFFFLGFCNAGIRVLRITYLLDIIPTRLIGRSNSVFNVMNSMIRMILIGLFSIPFFNIDNNVIYAFLIMGVILSLALVITITYRKAIIKLVVSK